MDDRKTLLRQATPVKLRRDTARCVATELLFNRPVYTLDNREKANRTDTSVTYMHGYDED
jgi:hypothetical protein